GNGWSQSAEEESGLSLLDGQRALDRKKAIAHAAVFDAEGCGDRPDLQPYAGERLQDAVVKVPRESNALLAGGNRLQLFGDVELIERCADLAAYDFGQRHDFGRRRANIGEKDAARHTLSLQRSGC